MRPRKTIQGCEGGPLIFSLLPRVAEEIRALYVGASFPAAVAVDEKEECIEVEAEHFLDTEIFAIAWIAYRQGLLWSIGDALPREGVRIRLRYRGPVSNIIAVHERLAAVGPVLEKIDDSDPIHAAARDMWAAIKADLGWP